MSEEIEEFSRLIQIGGGPDDISRELVAYSHENGKTEELYSWCQKKEVETAGS